MCDNCGGTVDRRPGSRYCSTRCYRQARGKRARARHQAELRALKDRPCADCGQGYPYWVMQFDHRPGEVKAFHVSRGVDLGRVRLLAEAAKCDVVCANCHATRTHNRLGI